MYFGQFLVGMSATSIIVAAWTYIATGSFWQALAWTLVDGRLFAGHDEFENALLRRRQFVEQTHGIGGHFEGSGGVADPAVDKPKPSEASPPPEAPSVTVGKKTTKR
ncbi:hypothetical protein [Mesorhizobium sp. NZP2298]|uniref:hypothetical protein n=1 Tax=Mesorhizobium sp. NZP2298 TaxID=2483403 RepID=UPI001556201A|nr:hypothetical protein [Mesorhizobium sp. NZP2298]QKC95862.1 hypothetical protein EB231_14920 [Mesorhizobium sp. NZP2298]